jgi:predicted dehydrogenase
VAYRPDHDPRFGEVNASVAATLRFPSGGLAQFVASFGGAPVDNYRVIGTLGDLELDPGFKFETATKLRLRREESWTETQFPQIDHFGAQIAYFSDCIAGGTPPESDGEEGLADIRVLVAIENACLTGKPQTIVSRPRPRHPAPDMVRLAAPTDRRLVL